MVVVVLIVDTTEYKINLTAELLRCVKILNDVEHEPVGQSVDSVEEEAPVAELRQ